MSSFTDLGVAAIRDGVRDGSFTAREVAEAYIAKVEAARGLNAFIVETPELALAAAHRVDRSRAAGAVLALGGVPVSIKDNYCVAGVQATAGSKILHGFVPTYTATVAQRVLDVGGLCVGKTNMDEFGMGSSTENSAYGVSRNYAAVEVGLDNVTPGGSSGGAATAVAAHLSAASLASDTGGSIRQPASFCGVVGYKPTYGLASRWGIIAYASSLDQAGVIARSVLDAAIIADVIVAQDRRDSTSLGWRNPGFERSLRPRRERCRVGIPRQLREVGSSPDLEHCWHAIDAGAASAGWEVVEVDLPSIGYALPAYYVIALCEASSNLARYDGVRYGIRVDSDPPGLTEMYEATRSAGFSSETKRRIILGTFALSAGYFDAYYLQAARVRRKITDEFNRCLESVDIIAMPAAPTPAFEFGGHKASPLDMYLEDVFTVPLNLAGLPGICIPGAQSSTGLPMGVQLIGAALEDHLLFARAGALESALPN